MRPCGSRAPAGAAAVTPSRSRAPPTRAAGPARPGAGTGEEGPRRPGRARARGCRSRRRGRRGVRASARTRSARADAGSVGSERLRPSQNGPGGPRGAGGPGCLGGDERGKSGWRADRELGEAGRPRTGRKVGGVGRGCRAARYKRRGPPVSECSPRSCSSRAGARSSAKAAGEAEAVERRPSPAARVPRPARSCGGAQRSPHSCPVFHRQRRRRARAAWPPSGRRRLPGLGCDSAPPPPSGAAGGVASRPSSGRRSEGGRVSPEEPATR